MFMRAVKRISQVLALTLFSSLALAEDFIEGKHYVKLATPVPVSQPGKIEVAELFWYGCPHCFDFEPYIEPWSHKLPEDVRFERVPATFSKLWKTHATAYYAAQALGIGEKLHADFFNSIHLEKKRLSDNSSIAKFFAEYGVTEADAKKALKSFGVKSKVQQAGARVRGYQSMGVPGLVVNGKYRIDTGSAPGGWPGMLKVAEYLIEKERQAQ